MLFVEVFDIKYGFILWNCQGIRPIYQLTLRVPNELYLSCGSTAGHRSHYGFLCSILLINFNCIRYVTKLGNQGSVLFISSWAKWIVSFLQLNHWWSESFQCNISDIGFAPLNFLPVPLKSFLQFINLCQR